MSVAWTQYALFFEQTEHEAEKLVHDNNGVPIGQPKKRLKK